MDSEVEPVAHTRVAVGLGWLAAGVAVLQLGALGAGEGARVALLATLSLTFGLWVFATSGGWHITAVGCYNFAFALFVGFGGLYQWWVVRDPDTIHLLVPAIACVYVINVVTWMAFWSGRTRRERPGLRPPGPPASSASLQPVAGTRSPTPSAISPWSLVGVGSLLSLLSVVGTFLFGAAGLWLTAFGESGLILLAAGLFLGGHRKNWFVKALVMGAAFAFVISQISTGYGRLRIGATGLALLIIMVHGAPRYVPKLTIFALLGPVLVAFGDFRLNKEAAAHPNQVTSLASTDVNAKGLGSVVSPVESFARLLDLYRHGLLPMDWGKTFLVSLLSFVPRSMWPGKPVGFGAELVPVLHPGLVGTGQSDAGLAFGEWLFDFGYTGLILMIPVIGLGVRLIDVMLVTTRGKPLADMRKLMIFLSGVTLAVGLSDLVWADSFTFTVRAASRLVVLLGALWLIGSKKLRTSSTVHPDPNNSGIGADGRKIAAAPRSLVE